MNRLNKQPRTADEGWSSSLGVGRCAKNPSPLLLLLKFGNACYYSVLNLLSSRLLSKNLKIKIYRTIILPVVLYGCEPWSLTLREESRLRIIENRVLRRIFGPKRDGVTGE